MLAQLGLSRGVEAGQVIAGGPHAERERLPPLLEGRVLDAHFERRFLDLVQARFLEQLGQVPFPRAREPEFAFDAGVELARRLPVRAEWAGYAGVIPDAGCDDASLETSRAPSLEARRWGPS